MILLAALLLQIPVAGAAPSVAATTAPDVAIWVALIMSAGAIVAAWLQNRRSSRHSAQIQELRDQVTAVKAQLRRERLTWHWWARQVVAYLRSLPDGQDIADGLPPIPESIKHSVVTRTRGRGRHRKADGR